MKKMTCILMIVSLYLVLAVNFAFATGSENKIELIGINSYSDHTYFLVKGDILGPDGCASGTLHRVELPSAADGAERLSRMYALFLSHYMSGQGDIYVQFDNESCIGANSDGALIYGVRLLK